MSARLKAAWAIAWPFVVFIAILSLAIGAGIAFPGSRPPRVHSTSAPAEQDEPVWEWGGQRDG